MIMMTESTNGWRPRVIKTSAVTGDGTVALVEAISQHSAYVKSHPHSDEAVALRLRHDVLEAARQYFEEVKLEEIASSRRFEGVMRKVLARKVDPYTAARELLSRR